jgi:hypothetical protein
MSWDVFLKPANTDPRQWWSARQWVGTIEGDDQAQAWGHATQLYRKAGYDLAVQPAPKQKRPEFNPTEALARYRELEGLLNLELINNPKWQAMRAQGDTSFILTSRHHQAQEQLLEEIEKNGYTIIDSEDENENPVYEIEPLEEETGLNE